MRRKGEQRLKARRYDTAPSWLVRRVAEGDQPIAIWMSQLCWTIARLAKATGILEDRILSLSTGAEEITASEADRIGAVMLVAPRLLAPPPY